MNASIILLAVVIVMLIIVLVSYIKQRTHAAALSQSLIDKQAELERANLQLTSTIEHSNKLNDELSVQRQLNATLQERNRAIEEMQKLTKQSQEQSQEQLKSVFENMANRIFEQRQNIGNENLKSVLEPFSKSIDEFKSRIEDNIKKEIATHASLSTELKNLMELNQQLSSEANNLTKALKGEKNNKIQGDWGEMILETILESSGLARDEHYFIQEGMRGDDGGSQRPDVIVKYPDNREIIIDSKVSLVAYSNYCSAENDTERDIALAKHLSSIKSHIDSLSDKKYDNRENSLDFVMMFMPIEAAYMLALHSDQKLWEYAYKRRVIIVTPTHLITALKMVHDLWKRDTQNKSVMQIVERATRMYDKFDVFVGYMDNIGSSITKSQKEYDLAMNTLKHGNGNILKQVQDLQKLGIKGKRAKSNIPTLEQGSDTLEQGE